MESQGNLDAKSMDVAQALYERCCSHDRHLRNAAFQQLGEFLLRVAYSRLRSRPDLAYLAEECTQQALEIIWQKLRDAQGPDHTGWFMSWSASIVIHKVLDELRKVSRTSVESLELAQTNAEPLSGVLTGLNRNLPEEEILAAEVRDELLRLIEEHPRLTPEAKFVLLGGYFKEQNDGELATQLNKAPVTIRVIRSRGLKILREDYRFISELQALTVLQLF